MSIFRGCYVIMPHLILLLWMAGKKTGSAPLSAFPPFYHLPCGFFKILVIQPMLWKLMRHCAPGAGQSTIRPNHDSWSRLSPATKLPSDLRSKSWDIIWPGVWCLKREILGGKKRNLQVLFTFCVIRGWKESERALVVTDGIGLLIGPLLNISKKAKKRQNESKVSAPMAS